MRLDKFVCASTGLSRKEAGRVIRAQEISINGEPCRKTATVVSEQDDITWLGQALQIIGPRYLIMHKPKGVVCSTDDPVHPSVFMLLDEPKQQDIHCVGRLDVDTTGLLLLTDDGKWSHKITSPKHAIRKTYIATLADPIATAEAEQITKQFAAGIMLRGEQNPTRPARFELLEPQVASVEIDEGRYHQVKRMFAAVGNKVVELHRSHVGDLALDCELEPGEYRPLSEQEVAMLS